MGPARDDVFGTAGPAAAALDRNLRSIVVALEFRTQGAGLDHPGAGADADRGGVAHDAALTGVLGHCGCLAARRGPLSSHSCAAVDAAPASDRGRALEHLREPAAAGLRAASLDRSARAQ